MKLTKITEKKKKNVSYNVIGDLNSVNWHFIGIFLYIESVASV